MSIAKPFTFVAGQKARANEVNADFDTLYSQVNINIADIAQINRDVDSIEANKADINGNSTQRFAVANPVNTTDAVNKQTLSKSITNVLDLINGLIIEKDTNSPNDTILVNPGSCYDSTKQVILELTNITSKQNINQGANTTYYVYIIGNETGSSIDIIISNSSVEPTLPTGYTKFRNIGSFTTDSDNSIDKIYNYSISLLTNPSYIIDWCMPDYTAGINIASLPYTAPTSGFVYLSLDPDHGELFINEARVGYMNIVYNQAYYLFATAFVAKGDVVTANKWLSTAGYSVFYPLKGVK